MSAQVHKAGVLSGRSLALLASFAVPLLFFYGLARNIGADDFPPFDPPLQASFIDPQPQPAPQPVPQPAPESPLGLRQTELVLTPPAPTFPENDSIGAIEEPPYMPVGGPVAAPIPPTPLKYTALRPSDDFYPPMAIRMGEQGSTDIRVCVTTAGLLQGLPTVTASSGYKRLDAAAVSWARGALRFEAATQNGAAVAACKGFRVNFRLR